MCSRMIQYGRETHALTIITIDQGNGLENALYAGLVRDDNPSCKSMPPAKLPDITGFEHHGNHHKFDQPVTLLGRIGALPGKGRAFWIETHTAIFKGIISRWPMGVGIKCEPPEAARRTR